MAILKAQHGTKFGQYKGLGIGFMNNPRENYITEKDYYNPKKEEGITSGDKKMDFLYNNQWLFKVPGVRGELKKKAEEYGELSGGAPSMSKSLIAEKLAERDSLDTKPYTGNYWVLPEHIEDVRKVNLLGQYLRPNKNVSAYQRGYLTPSKYTPKSDYLKFLPSYGVKKDQFDKFPVEAQSNYVQDAVRETLQHDENKLSNRPDYKGYTPKQDSLLYERFLRNKTPIFDNTGYSPSPLSKAAGVDLSGHKVGMAWDEEINTPYVSIADAWDFNPDSYSKKWDRDGNGSSEENRQRAKIQSALMHKAGHPFKIYDRFYFDPTTRQYLPDDSVANRRTKAQGLLKKKQDGGAIQRQSFDTM